MTLGLVVMPVLISCPWGRFVLHFSSVVGYIHTTEEEISAEA